MSIQVRHMFITADWVAWTIRRFGEIWQYAKDNGYAIVSKDSDFQERSVLRGHPPKIIWLRATNYTSAEIEGLLRAAVAVIARFIQEDRESCLVLAARVKTR
jgi:predicted nuclease of predicted toxin-antitoxin system